MCRFNTAAIIRHFGPDLPFNRANGTVKGTYRPQDMAADSNQPSVRLYAALKQFSPCVVFATAAKSVDGLRNIKHNDASR